ncbi:MAG: hypothetical protein OXG81_04430 [Acidobacteria bacterium]|nr:hypothetical protein [Acidobacteriota bacterium]
MFGLGRELRAAALSVAVLAAAVPVAATGSEPPWQRLEFRAKKFFLSADAAVEFDSTAPLPADDRCEGRPSLPASAARIRIESSMFGRRSQSSLWFDAESLQAHVRVQEERGSRNRYKRYTFCQGTVEAERATPNDGEADLPVASWTHRYPLVHEVPAELTAPLSEPSALLHLVARLAAPQAEGGAASRTVPVFSNSQVLAVRIDRHPETIPAMPGFSVAGGPSPEELTLARFTLTPLAIGSDGGVEDFELLGLEGEIEILAARELQLPVSISGRLPPAGRVTVRLRHVELRENQ